MYEPLFIGNKLVRLDEVDSTNAYLQELISNNEREVEGLVVIADKQYSGKGQRGKHWYSDDRKNLTFSIFLKPNIEVKNQFLISKLVSLGVIDFLLNKGLEDIKIKWPNDIYYRDKKLSGILIENSIRGNKICNSVIGVGLNVNQTSFPSEIVNPIALIGIMEVDEIDMKEALNELLFFIEKRYLMLKSDKVDSINNEYLQYLYWINEPRKFQVVNRNMAGTITGVSSIGKLQVKVKDEIKEFDLKEIIFLE